MIRFLQDLKEKYHFHHLDRLDWITRNALRMKKEYGKDPFPPIRPDAKSVLFWSTGAWERGSLDSMLQFSLALRGHSTVGIHCDGGFSACSMESVHFPRADCDTCSQRAHRLRSIFPIERFMEPISQHLDEELFKEQSKLIDSLTTEELEEYAWQRHAVAQVAKRDLPQYLFRLPDLSRPEDVERWRLAIKATLRYLIGAEKALETHQPDLCFVTSGKTVAYGPIYEACRRRGIRVVTWDESLGRVNFVFTHNGYANEYPLNSVWPTYREVPLHPDQIAEVDAFFKKTAVGKKGAIDYYEDTILDHDQIRYELGIVEGRRVITLLTNVVWDTSVLDRNIFTDSIVDWVFSTIDTLMNAEDTQLLIRCHPAEGRVEKFMQSEELLSDIIRQRYPELPDHITVIPGESQINSHSLVELSNLSVVYSTTVGLEMAARGYAIATCGDVHYRDKGFTIDVNTKESYRELLLNPEVARLDEEQVELCYRYAYLWISRFHHRLDEFLQPTRHTFEIEDPGAFRPGASHRWDFLCNRLLDGEPFLSPTP